MQKWQKNMPKQFYIFDNICQTSKHRKRWKRERERKVDKRVREQIEEILWRNHIALDHHHIKYDLNARMNIEICVTFHHDISTFELCV